MVKARLVARRQHPFFPEIGAEFEHQLALRLNLTPLQAQFEVKNPVTNPAALSS